MMRVLLDRYYDTLCRILKPNRTRLIAQLWDLIETSSFRKDNDDDYNDKNKNDTYNKFNKDYKYDKDSSALWLDRDLLAGNEKLSRRKSHLCECPLGRLNSQCRCWKCRCWLRWPDIPHLHSQATGAPEPGKPSKPSCPSSQKTWPKRQSFSSLAKRHSYTYLLHPQSRVHTGHGLVPLPSKSSLPTLCGTIHQWYTLGSPRTVPHVCSSSLWFLAHNQSPEFVLIKQIEPLTAWRPRSSEPSQSKEKNSSIKTKGHIFWHMFALEESTKGISLDLNPNSSVQNVTIKY